MWCKSEVSKWLPGIICLFSYIVDFFKKLSVSTFVINLNIVLFVEHQRINNHVKFHEEYLLSGQTVSQSNMFKRENCPLFSKNTNSDLTCLEGVTGPSFNVYCYKKILSLMG